jgi:dihydrolipoamide dehydrogenase
MKTISVDVAVIGAGTAGMTAFHAASKHTDKLVLIESGPYGTMCARVGCMPSKLLIAAADAAHAANHAGIFGVRVEAVVVDGAAVMQRVRDERDRFAGFAVRTVERWPEHQRLHGHARFVDAHTLDVRDAAGEGTRVQARRVVIATGSRPVVPAAWRRALGELLVVNDDVFSWTDLPRSVAVVGAGVIGLELAQALHRLGVRVTLYGRGSTIGPLSDPALKAIAVDVFARELPLRLDTGEVEVVRDGDDVVVRSHAADGGASRSVAGDTAPAREGSAAREERFDLLLAAIGRKPAVDGLGLETTGLPLDAAGVPRFDRHCGQIGDSHVFIAGDADADRPLLHEAADDGRIAGDNAGRWPDVRMRPRRAPLAVVFSDPQLAIAGASHAELTKAGTPFAVGDASFEDQGRSRVIGKNAGALHIYASPDDGRVLGAEMVCPAAEHLAHLLAWSVQRGDTVQQMLDSPFYHPVIEEGLHTALRAAARALRMGPPPVERCLECGPGA